MNIINMEGFRQIKENEALSESLSPDYIMDALRANGVSVITEWGSSPATLTRGSLTVNNIERTGLKMTTDNTFRFNCAVPDLSKSAVQFGFRLTMSQEKKNHTRLFSVFNDTFDTNIPNDGASSYYFEIFLTYDGINTITTRVYCNSAVIHENTFLKTQNATDSFYITIGSSSMIFQKGLTGTVIIGDMYMATTDYGENNAASPELLGSIEVHYSPVASFTGDQHVISNGSDAVTSLNSSSADTGYLVLAPTTQAAEITFGEMDVTGKTVVASKVSVVYQGASAPNNYLAVQAGSGGEKYAEAEVLDASADTGTWSTEDSVHMLPPGGGSWGNSIGLSVSLYNRTRE
ncbi:hypothetical protein [Escherichia coli]|uniref:hypothetical protein n=1 Tax=Escherichia coli TaxID=562 RepID=UPI001F0E81D9|nr:hypothetical protein [Escherichia coli]UMR99252.1 hypothetical protein AOY87_13960 [Escherichia coli]